MDNILIMKKKYLFMATAVIMMTGCASDDLVGDENISSGETPIAFNMNTSKVTRATLDDKQAADSLGNEFIVWGEKNESNGAKAKDGELVFQNYRVQYKANTANTTISNTADWEYVGITPYAASTTANEAFVSPSVNGTASTGKTQTIKYWDDAASSYTFTAVSASNSDITNGRVKITKTETGENSSDYAKGYTIEVGAGANPARIYVADRKPVTKAEGSSTYARNAVQLQFRNFMSKVRFGIYENIPGYKVVITGIKFNTATGQTAVEHPTSDQTPVKTFGIDGNFITPGANTKYKVTYVATGANTNKAQVEVVSDNSNTPATKDTLQTAGTTWLSTTKDNPIATASSSPTYDNGNGTYKIIMPNPTNNKGMTLTISYDLYSEDTGEKISVGYRTAEVPAEYCQWKSNYAYTYLFKITDKSADLYPITFDAVVETEDNGNQETITEVSDKTNLVSITTYGIGTDNKVITGKDEYTAGSTIYASVVDNATTVTKDDLDDRAKLYTVVAQVKSGSNGTAPAITEGNVANCLASTKSVQSTVENSSLNTWTITDLNNGQLVVTEVASDAYEFTNQIPTEEGLASTYRTGTMGALKWKPTAAATYVVEYTYNNKKVYKIVKVVASN